MRPQPQIRFTTMITGPHSDTQTSVFGFLISSYYILRPIHPLRTFPNKCCCFLKSTLDFLPQAPLKMLKNKKG